MRLLTKFSVLTILTLLFTAGCGPSLTSRSAMEQDAASILTVLKRKLSDNPSFFEGGAGAGQAGNIKTIELTFLVDTTECSPEAVFDLTEEAFTEWGQYDSFSTRGHGGGGNHFKVHFGNHSSHVFLDVIAYAEDSRTIVKCLVRAVE